MVDLVTKNELQWWKDIVLRHSLEHAVLVVFYGLPNRCEQWCEEEVRSLLKEVGSRSAEFFDACVRQVFGAHLNSAETTLPPQSLHLLKLIAKNMTPTLCVEFDQFYHMWTIGACCRRPEKLKPFIQWMLDNSEQKVQQQALWWLIENSEDTPAHNMYWDLLSCQSWDDTVVFSPWGQPGWKRTWQDIIHNSDISNTHGENILKSWRQKKILWDCIDSDADEQDKRRI